MFSHRLIFIVNNIFDIGWLAIEYRLYWTQISYIGLVCASSNIAFFVQYNLYKMANHPILCIYIYIYVIFKSIPNYISPIEMQTPAEPDTGRQLHKYSTMQQAYT